MILQLELKDENQIEVIRAFLKVLKIKHSIKKENPKMSKKDYFEMLDESINEASQGKKKKLDTSLRQKLFA